MNLSTVKYMPEVDSYCITLTSLTYNTIGYLYSYHWFLCPDNDHTWSSVAPSHSQDINLSV